MKYGPGLDICVGAFDENCRWVDYSAPWYAVQPRLQPFQYADTKKDAYMLLEDFHVRVGKKVRSALAGFDYDGSSKPRLVWSWLGHPLSVDGLVQFTVHDMDYCMNLVPRTEADWTMLEGLDAFGRNNWVNRNAVWSAVKIGGKGIYPKTQKELDEYKDYVMLTNLNLTGGKCLDERLTGKGPRKSARPEVELDWGVYQPTSKLEGLLI